jgi:hypothetical protein
MLHGNLASWLDSNYFMVLEIEETGNPKPWKSNALEIDSA